MCEILNYYKNIRSISSSRSEVILLALSSTHCFALARESVLYVLTVLTESQGRSLDLNLRLLLPASQGKVYYIIHTHTFNFGVEAVLAFIIHCGDELLGKKCTAILFLVDACSEWGFQ